jgi:hypothetical protein
VSERNIKVRIKNLNNKNRRRRRENNKERIDVIKENIERQRRILIQIVTAVHDRNTGR